uniref:CPSF_A domain-containing protein n=1 Tax=Schistosoma mansoni TaxID=6183 RepID=A0A5K4FDV1_SCHMA
MYVIIMNSNSYSRSWNGVGDDVHPLSRTGHSAVAHGRYIYVLNGYGPSDDKMVLFEQMGITRYDILTNRIECLPVHWDLKSLQNHMFNEFILLTSGNSAVLCPELLDKNNKKQSACIYTFGGYSLLGNIHLNALCRYELTHTNLSKYITSSSPSSMHRLYLHDSLIPNKLLLWITPSQIHNPVNYSRNGIDHLTQYIQQTIMSTLIWYQNRSTFFIDIVHAPNILNTLNELFPSRSSLSSITMQTLNKPIHRHWHTITLGLNGLVYVIGGASQEALEKPLECYNLHRPISLIKQCSIKITKLILSRLLYEIECDYLKGNGNHHHSNNIHNSTAILPYSCHLNNNNKSKMDFLKNLDEKLENLLNSHVKYLLEEWLL